MKNDLVQNVMSVKNEKLSETKINLRRIVGLNVKDRILKFIEGNKKENIHDLGNGKYFLNTTQKAEYYMHTPVT